MMRMRLPHLVTLVILLALLAMQSGQAVSVSAAAAQKGVNNSLADAGVYNPSTDQIIVKYKGTGQGLNISLNNAAQVKRLSQAAGTPLTYLRVMFGGAQVLRLPGMKPVADVQAIAERIAQLPEVEYAEPDDILYHTIMPIEDGYPRQEQSLMPSHILSPAMVPNDTYYANQWHYSPPTAGNYGINLPAAWDVTTGSANVVVAVIDSGITTHPEFTGRIVPGYDFINDSFVSNDGDGRDSDPTDPGDWTAANFCYSGWQERDSSWYGTHAAGIIGAAANNGTGVAGINWNAKILPVRVSGRCGGHKSDILDGMGWAAGFSVPGVPANANSAKVILVSLGGGVYYWPGSCSYTEQSVIDTITTAGTTIVVGAGNDSGDASNNWPGSCSGVISVAATNRYGSLASYSNYGSTVKIAAPGGDQNFGIDGILSTWNAGKTVAGSPAYQYYKGTGLAAAQVAGVVSLLYSLQPTLTPARALYYIQSTATQFPSGSSCSTSLCGSGIVNAGAAVAALLPSKTNTNVTIASHLPNPSEVGQAVTVKFTITPASGSGTPTGTVTVSDGTSSCTNPIAVGQCVITFTSSGTKTLVASYSGDSNFNGNVSAQVAHTVQNSARKWPMNIPLMFHDSLTYFIGPMEHEPNDYYYQSNGPLISGKEYQGYPDEKDYFSIYLDRTSNISVILKNHTGSLVQLQLFYQDVNNRVAWTPSPPYSLLVPAAQPGWYYVYIYCKDWSGATEPYSLTVSH